MEPGEGHGFAREIPRGRRFDLREFAAKYGVGVL